MKAQLFKTLVIPVLLYGSGTWIPTVKDMQRLCGFYHRAARRAGAFPGRLTPQGWRIEPATVVREKMRLPTMEDALREERLRLLGQLMRLSNPITKEAHTACPGHHRRASMRECWWVVTHRDMTSLNLTPQDAHTKKWAPTIKAPRPGRAPPQAAPEASEDSRESTPQRPPR